jgi:hypothetical protein
VVTVLDAIHFEVWRSDSSFRALEATVAGATGALKLKPLGQVENTVSSTQNIRTSWNATVPSIAESHCSPKFGQVILSCFEKNHSLHFGDYIPTCPWPFDHGQGIVWFTVAFKKFKL